MISGLSSILGIRITDVFGVKCKNCDARKSLELISYNRYMHIFFVPFVTSGKESRVLCNNCGAEYRVDIQPERIKELARSEQGLIKTPLWHFSGLGIVIALFITLIFLKIRDNQFNDIYIKSPKMGDVYSMDEGDGFYTTSKVTSVTQDSIFIKFNTHEVSEKRGLSELEKESEFFPFSIGYSRAEIEALYETDEIFSISRD